MFQGGQVVCQCGDNYDRHGPSNSPECHTPCPMDDRYFCGGLGKQLVQRINGGIPGEGGGGVLRGKRGHALIGQGPPNGGAQAKDDREVRP